MAVAGEDEAGRADVYSRRRVATGLFAVALGFPLLTLSAWVSRLDPFHGLGKTNYAVPPLSVLLFLLVALGAACAHFGKRRAATALSGVALGLLALLASLYLFRSQLGPAALLLPHRPEQFQLLNRGTSGIGAIVVLILDCVAILLIARRSAVSMTGAVLLASTSLGLTALLATMVLITPPPGISSDIVGRWAGSAIPSFALGGGLLLSALDGSREERFGFEYDLLRRLSPSIILLPVFPSLFALITIGGHVLSLNEAQFLVVVCNVLILALLLAVGLRSARQQSEAMRLREEQLRSILASVPDAVIVIDGRGIGREFSAAAGELWRLPPGTAPGCPMGDYLGPKEREKLSQLLASGEPEFLLSGEGLRADGTRFPLELRGSRFHGPEGEVRYTLFARDLSEKIAAQRRVARMGAQLAQASRHNAMGELAADLAHELNQPLTAAINYLSTVAYMLERPGSGGNPPEMVALARNQAMRAGEIIRRMRDFAQHRDVEKQIEPLVPMIEDAIQLVLAATGAQGLDIVLNVEPADLTVFVDRIQLQQVLVNLLRNAVEAIRSAERAGGQVIIAARPADEDWVEVQLCDDGPGLPDAIIDQLFERFTSTKADRGMGIGLSISRRIIEAHGGSMSAANREAGGASFRFTLPSPPDDEG